MRVSL